MMKLKPYLVFNGNALEAATHYAEIFGGQIGDIYRYGDCTPDVSVQYREKIMHLCLVFGDESIGMGDAEPGTSTTFGNGVILTVHCQSEQQIRSYYEALSQGGQVRCPLEQTFFARQYADLVDRYGVAWSLILE